MSYLRNNGMITERDYLDKTLEEATKYAEDGGFVVRVVEIDGISKMVTMDLNPRRINFIIKGGYVAAAYGG